jgi:hypothetical protein
MTENTSEGRFSGLFTISTPVNEPSHGRIIPTDQELREVADSDINDYWTRLGGALGEPKIPGDGGLIRVGEPEHYFNRDTSGAGGYYRDYANGTIYKNDNIDIHYVWGAIGERYTQLGRTASWLGWPTSNELSFADKDGNFADEDGRVTTFQNGAIYFWSDIGPREVNDVIVHYTGLHCFGETDFDNGLSDDDEPYATIGVIGPDGTKGVFRSQIYEDVDAGEGRFEVIEIYRGKPRGLVINTILQEHSGGDTEKSREIMGQIVDKGGAALAASAIAIPIVGPVVAPLLSAAHQVLKKDIADALNSFVGNTLGFADRPLGGDVTELTPKQMVVLATRPEGHSQFNEIPWRFETSLLSRFGATYKVYFNIFGA